MADPVDSFSRPPPEVTRYFEAKGIQPTFHWQDVNFDEHAMAFTVAKSAGFDILGDVQAAVGKAIAERQDFETFKAGLKPLLVAKGWWGETETIDPSTGAKITREVPIRLVDPLTDEVVDAQLGSTRRLRTIYWANVRTAFAAGQWERQWRTRRGLPFLLYLISTAENKRELHLEWVGTILPIEHEWWDTHYPPNGWNCQCRVRQISDREARHRGYDPDAPAPDDGFTMFRNKRTGETGRVPAGIDPGWAQNPGKARTSNMADVLAGRLDAMTPEARRIAVEDIAGDPLLERIASGRVGYDPADEEDQGNIERGKIALPVAVMPEALGAVLAAESNIVRLSVADANAAAAARADDAPPLDPRTFQRVLDAGRVEHADATSVTISGDVDGRPWRAILRRAADALGALYLAAFGPTRKEL